MWWHRPEPVTPPSDADRRQWTADLRRAAQQRDDYDAEDDAILLYQRAYNARLVAGEQVGPAPVRSVRVPLIALTIHMAEVTEEPFRLAVPAGATIGMVLHGIYHLWLRADNLLPLQPGGWLSFGERSMGERYFVTDFNIRTTATLQLHFPALRGGSEPQGVGESKDPDGDGGDGDGDGGDGDGERASAASGNRNGSGRREGQVANITLVQPVASGTRAGPGNVDVAQVGEAGDATSSDVSEDGDAGTHNIIGSSSAPIHVTEGEGVGIHTYIHSYIHTYIIHTYMYMW
jgi:hypothetical protein